MEISSIPGGFGDMDINKMVGILEGQRYPPKKKCARVFKWALLSKKKAPET